MEELQISLPTIKEQIEANLRNIHSEPAGRHEMLVAAMGFGAKASLNQTACLELPASALPESGQLHVAFSDLSLSEKAEIRNQRRHSYFA